MGRTVGILKGITESLNPPCNETSRHENPTVLSQESKNRLRQRLPWRTGYTWTADNISSKPRGHGFYRRTLRLTNRKDSMKPFVHPRVAQGFVNTDGSSHKHASTWEFQTNTGLHIDPK